MHYGVLGMKWGIRKNRSSSSSSKKRKSNEQRIKDIKTTRKVKHIARASSRISLSVGKHLYDKNKNRIVDPKTVNTVKSLGIVGNVLKRVGDIAAVSEYIQSYNYGRNYWKD